MSPPGALMQVPPTHFSPDLGGLNRGWAQVPHAHQVVGGRGQGEHPVHLENPTMPYLPQQRDRLQPPETFFDALPLLLAEPIPFMARRPPINRAPAPPLLVLRHVRRDPQSCGTRSRSPPCRSPCLRPPSPAPCPESVPASPAPRRARPSRWPRTLPCSRSTHSGSPPADSRCNSTWPPCPHFCAPAWHPDRSSIRASGSTAARRGNSPSGYPDPPEAADSSRLSAESSSGSPTLPPACHPR